MADVTVPRAELAAWAERFGIVAGITMRGPAGFSLGLWSEEPVGQVMTRWRAFRAAFASRFPSVVLSHQVHGHDVAWHDTLAPGWHLLDGADAHATITSGQLLTVTVADCIPVYVAVPSHGAVALAHAGWRGTAGRILDHTVRVLRRATGCSPTDMVMHCGVGICGGCYEVGSEVHEQLLGRPSAGPVRVDLRAVLAEQARALGIRDISMSSFCTAHDRDRFFSHRASGGKDGRLVAYVGLPRPVTSA